MCAKYIIHKVERYMKFKLIFLSWINTSFKNRNIVRIFVRGSVFSAIKTCKFFFIATQRCCRCLTRSVVIRLQNSRCRNDKSFNISGISSRKSRQIRLQGDHPFSSVEFSFLLPSLAVSFPPLAARRPMLSERTSPGQF